MRAIREALAAEAAAHPVQRKLVVGRTLGEAREVLRALTLAHGPWVGFEPMKLRALAQEVAARALQAEGLRTMDDLDAAALTDEALERVLETVRSARLGELAVGVGMRRAIGQALRDLRLAGISPVRLRGAPLRDAAKRDLLADVVEAYQMGLAQGGFADAAELYRLAAATLQDEPQLLPRGRILLLPGLSLRGRPGRFVELLRQHGAVALPGAAVHGMEPPPARLHPVSEATSPLSSAGPLSWLHAVADAPAPLAAGALELFSASSIEAELREVLRRTAEAGLRADQVEIVVAGDYAAYATALDSLARRLDVPRPGGERAALPVTYAAGLPLERTRPGRAVRHFLRWLAEDFPDEVLRGLLERGDVLPTNVATPVDGPTLARRLRRMRVGRGRQRYLEALDRAGRAVERPAHPEDDRASHEVAAELARDRAAVEGLEAIIRPLLARVPPLPERLGTHDVAVQPRALALALRTFLSFVPPGTAVDRSARERLEQRLERVATTLVRATSFETALATLREKLELGVPAPDAGGGAPWTSAGGHLHLSRLEHGGLADRPATFVVGLDAGSFPGAGLQDPLLGDDDRRILAGGTPSGALPRTSERIEERRWELAALLAGLRGHVCLSYAAWDAADGRALAPATELLQAHRLRTGNPTADYEELRGAFGGGVSAVPSDQVALDGRDVWLAALAGRGQMRAGRPLVLSAFPGLAAGMDARAARAGGEATPCHGMIQARPALDPRGRSTPVISATRLETLGTCAHRYLLRYVLGVQPPDDLELAWDTWLGPRDRGSLLHSVYERALQQMRTQGHALSDEARLEAVAMGMLDRELQGWRERVPPPGEAVYRSEARDLREDIRSFVRMVAAEPPVWLRLELAFGRAGAATVGVALTGGEIQAQGAIDRIDRLEDGALVVVDYKTGGTRRWARSTGAFHGGRRLQHVLYAAVAERVFGSPVARVEYHFPTARGENARVAYTRSDLADGLALVDALLADVAAGRFLPTDEPRDCMYCDFTDVCRVKVGAFGRTVSPPAAWMRRHGAP
ncbi:MAG: PD-(D/E)XK nuclease family protein [Gemmatimonadota bacterium]